MLHSSLGNANPNRNYDGSGDVYQGGPKVQLQTLARKCAQRRSIIIIFAMVLVVLLVSFEPRLIKVYMLGGEKERDEEILKDDSAGFIELDTPSSWMGLEHHIRMPVKLNPSLLFFIKVCKAGSRSLREDTKLITPKATAGYLLHTPFYGEFAYYNALDVKSKALQEQGGRFSTEDHFTRMKQRQKLKQKVQLFAIFREPRHHVYSQFMFCKLRKPEIELESWLDDFITMRPDEDYPYTHSCHDPRNLQTRFMVSRCKHDQCKYTSQPEAGNLSLSRAITHLRKLSYIAILERYKESLCDFSVMVGGGVTETSRMYCNISNIPQVHHSSHGVKPHSLDEVPPRLLKKMDRLTQLDQVLYNESLAVFEKQHERLKQFGFIPDTS